jgi:hypothetical protein
MSTDAEVLDPPVADLVVNVQDEDFGFNRTYVVKKIPFFMKWELTGILGKILDDSLSGPNGISVAQLMESLNEDADPDQAGDLQGMLEQFGDPDVFIKAIVKLASSSPEHIVDLYCLFLAIPKEERPLAKMIMSRDEDEGGLTDDQGMGILESWMEINGQVVRDFFVRRLGQLFKKHMPAAAAKASSSSSRRTRRNTRKG